MPTYNTITGQGTPPPPDDGSYEIINVVEDTPPLEAPDPDAPWLGDTWDDPHGPPETVQAGYGSGGSDQPPPDNWTPPPEPTSTSDASSYAADELPGRLGNLTDAERQLRSEHPEEFIKMVEAGGIAIAMTKLQFGDDGGDGMRGNAYQHALWNAIMTQSMGPDRAAAWGHAHEDYTGNPPANSSMDLYNNEVGRQIGANLPPNSSLDTIVGAVDRALANGDLVWNR